jgi:cell division protein FtsZ
VTVIATGFDRRTGGQRLFDQTQSRSKRRDVVMDDRQRSSLEIPDDEIDIPEFLKD